MQLSVKQAQSLDRATILRLNLVGTDRLPAVSMQRGKFYAMSPVSKRALAAAWNTPQEALASVIRHRWEVE